MHILKSLPQLGHLYLALCILPLFFTLSLQAISRQTPSKISLPTIVLIPGAWHSPQHYAKLIDSLEACKFDVVTERLPSVGSKTPREQSVFKDADFIQNHLLLPIISSGKDVLLLMHSYGGCPGADAAKGLSKADRQAAGKKGGIIGLVFMCAFVAGEGDSLKSKLPGQQYDPWVVQNVSFLTYIISLSKYSARTRLPNSLSTTRRTSSTILWTMRLLKRPYRSFSHRLSHLFPPRAGLQPGQMLSITGSGRTSKRSKTTQFRSLHKMLWSRTVVSNGTSPS